MMAENDAIEVHGREVTATRIFDAPRALVWRAFTDPDHLKHWWGPNGFTCTFHEFDLRPGGAWHFIMHGPGRQRLRERVGLRRRGLDGAYRSRSYKFSPASFDDAVRGCGHRQDEAHLPAGLRVCSMTTKRSSPSLCRGSHKILTVGLRICRRSIPTGAS